MIAGRYSLDREIGRGGTGVVWLGRDEVLGRPVALKRIGLLPGADRTDLARAEREARMSARLNHRHVVAVFDVVVDPESDVHWLVMEYVDGITFDQLVRRGGQALARRRRAVALAGGRRAGRRPRRGIAHRDVKPSNILVDRNWQVKLTDFGIARIATDPSLTQTGMVTGSPAYLAPEIATGFGATEAADVWSLGATTYHLLAGRPPYEVGDNVLGALYRIVNEEPPRLGDAGWMAPMLEGTMVRDPARRWTMAQVRDFLADPDHVPPFVAAPPGGEGTQPLATVPPAAAPAATRASSGSRRPRPLLVLVGVLLALVVAAGAWLAWPDGEPAAKNTTTPSASPTPSPSRSAEPSAAPKPTAAGIESFIRKYVDTVASDPDASYQMLSPKFQQESGGIDTYREYWDSATDGRVLSISANPDNLTVSYQVRFANHENGPGPTVLDLVFVDGRYLIDGERTQGFQPAG